MRRGEGEGKGRCGGSEMEVRGKVRAEKWRYVLGGRDFDADYR